MGGASGRGRRAVLAVTLGAGACGILPDEFNLAPLYRHRVAENGDLQELDVLWPIVHYERTPEGGADFRVRPFYRYVEHMEQAAVTATEHQFLWPLGRVYTDAEETRSRLFPFWSRRRHKDQDGKDDVDWHLFPFFWGGHNEREPGEDYFGLFPIAGSIPDFLTYDRYTWVLWPLYSRTDKGDETGHMFLFFVAGFGGGTYSDSAYWHRVLPLYSVNVRPEMFARYSVLWPFIHWGWDYLDTGDPARFWFVWPFLGRKWSVSGDHESWTWLWPFFQYTRHGDEAVKWDGPWPFFRYYRNDRHGKDILQWWVWPLITVTHALNFDSTVLLWPLIWIREFRDVGWVQRGHYFIPLYWDTVTHYDDGDATKGAVRVFPVVGTVWDKDGKQSVRILDPVPYDFGGREGWDENYGFLWSLFTSHRDAQGETRTDLFGEVFSSRIGEKSSKMSVPFLFNREVRADGSGVLRLFQLIPIPFGGQ
jgi:hypothetical protein